VFTTRFQVVYLTATLGAFTLAARLARARLRRALAALCAVLVFFALSAPIDNFAARMGWWTYPTWNCPTCVNLPHPPPAVYLGQSLLFVGCLAILGWRIQRRSGARGLALLALAVCIAGPIRDFSVAAALPDVIRFGPMPAAALADVAAWAIVLGTALAVPRLIAGPAHADAPR
jgi:hypothetical protein